MRKWIRSNWPRAARLSGTGLLFGLALGYVSHQYDWGISYLLAIAIVFGCGLGVEAIDSLTAAAVSPKFAAYPRGKRLALQMSTSLLVHAGAWLLLVWVAGRILNFSLFQWQVLIWLVPFIVIFFIIRSLSELLKLNRELRRKDLMEEQLKTLAAQAELKALKAQINPHFLFNSLNTVASLINTDPGRAEEAVEKLSDIFRYTLSSSNREFVTLQEELDFLDSYFDIEKVRFGDRLEVVRIADPEVLSTRIPSLILQPLVENCVKHGASKEGKARIEILCRANGNDVRIEIRDEGKGAPEEIKKGVFTRGTGLKNVSERLKKLYGDAYGLKIGDNKPQGTVATVAIPREKA
jgi:sensor histidine kinase YesM